MRYRRPRLPACARGGCSAALAGLAVAMTLADPLMQGHLGMAKAMCAERVYHQAEHATHCAMGAPPAALGHGVVHEEGAIAARRRVVREQGRALMPEVIGFPGVAHGKAGGIAPTRDSI